MGYALNDDQRRVQDLVRRVARERVASRAAAIDASGEYPQDMYDLLRELGLFTLPFPGGVRRQRQHALGLRGHRGARARLL